MKIKKLLFPIAAITMSCVFAFSACGGPEEGKIDPNPDSGITRPDGGQTPPDTSGGGFTNPGDSLGGGGTGDVSDPIDDSANDVVKGEIIDKSDLDGLADNTTSKGAITQEATNEIVEISESGDYYFKGKYGGIHITGEKLKLHFIFDGVTISTENGVAIDGTSDAKKAEVVITLNEGTTNTVTNSGTDKKGKEVNAIHIKGSLAINGTGTLNVTSESKSALKASKEIQIVNATLNLSSVNHAVTGLSVTASNCTINVLTAGKDGINAECDDETTEFTTEEGFVSLKNVTYTCSVAGDGIQADTVVYIDGGSYDITTNGVFVQKTTANMEEYDMTADDFKFIKSGNHYVRIASDETGRYNSSQLYGLTQGCKGIKVGEIEYPDPDDDDIEYAVTEGEYLIVIVSGTFSINSTDDAIHANSGDVLIEGGTFTLSTYDDAITADGLTKITGGDITITTCYEGIEGAYVEISGGTIALTSTDDGINAASNDNTIIEHIIISGGDITVDASGDGLDSNGSILISGGTVVIYGPTSGMDAGMDADRGIVITGGKVFVASTLGMVETPASNSTQYVVSYAHQSMITAGSVITLCDKDGNVILAATVQKNCQSIIFSTPDLINGETYSLYGGDTQLTSFTVSSIITTIGSAGGNFPGGMGPGGKRPGGMGGPRR